MSRGKLDAKPLNIDGVVRSFLKDNLTIEIKTEEDDDCDPESSTTITVALLFNGSKISEDSDIVI